MADLSPRSGGDFPDPALATMQQVLREVSALKETVFTRLDGMDEAIKLFNANITRVPTDTDKQIGHLKELFLETFKTVGVSFDLMNEKFAGVQTQIKDRDTRVEATARDTQKAVDAALQAAKEAVGKQNEASSQAIAKSEGATTKQIDQMGELIRTTKTAADERINDIKERLAIISGTDQGQKETVTTQQASSSSLVNVIGLIVAIVLGAASLILTVMNSRGG